MSEHSLPPFNEDLLAILDAGELTIAEVCKRMNRGPAYIRSLAESCNLIFVDDHHKRVSDFVLMRVNWCSLRDLPGIKSVKRIRAASIITVEKALWWLDRFEAITSAGSDGAINVWHREDTGQMQCEFCRFRSTVDKLVTRELEAVEAWLKEWLPRLEGGAA